MASFRLKHIWSCRSPDGGPGGRPGNRSDVKGLLGQAWTTYYAATSVLTFPPEHQSAVVGAEVD